MKWNPGAIRYVATAAKTSASWRYLGLFRQYMPVAACQLVGIRAYVEGTRCDVGIRLDREEVVNVMYDLQKGGIGTAFEKASGAWCFHGSTLECKVCRLVVSASARAPCL